MKPPVSVRVLAICIIAPSVAFFSVVAVGGILQGATNWLVTFVLIALACALILLAIETMRRGISIQNGMLVIHGLRRKELPISAVVQIRMTPSRSYPGLQLVSFIGMDGRVIGQLPPLWDVTAVASWAERVPIPSPRDP